MYESSRLGWDSTAGRMPGMRGSLRLSQEFYVAYFSPSSMGIMLFPSGKSLRTGKPSHCCAVEGVQFRLARCAERARARATLANILAELEGKLAALQMQSLAKRANGLDGMDIFIASGQVMEICSENETGGNAEKS